MSSLQTYHVDDWGKFICENDIDLSCPSCHGKNCEECQECSGSGYIEPMWNTIWNTGYHSGNRPTPAEFGCVFAFTWDEEIWFGLSGCGTDCTPYLARAWRKMFPDCQWLPEQFIVEGINLRDGYLEACLGERETRKIHTLIAKTIKNERHRARYLAADLREARKNLAHRSAKDRKVDG